MRTKVQALLFAAGVLAAGCAYSENQADAVILINPFTVPADKLNETILMWEQARNFLQKEPGYISTALHQSISPDAQYRLINIAQWESIEAFMAATKKMGSEANLPRIHGVRPSPALYTVVRRD
ncbi:MAG: antibiotic biosynthesis monooxygenase [Gammaproteobacteria bacterium]|nr:antibiotic biosynthesis monooxygenase [Gammaproteobacteria bacterium]MXY64129.1 antibiotic biosynthesis monooxygenase [Gammaproteobacteria bacterium]MYG67556.1 antibiotic biosynthesis monooxygenase [Gammaproteobacteria bacterium]MYH90966.1 antibiotic biosynthesis monooxygenase [Gammaproteobacteria bacterium]